jgi:hypothetical protein
MKALLLIGSPKRGASASRNFGEAVLARLAGRGVESRTERVTPILRSESARTRLLDAIAWADLVILSFPVYVDSLPAPVTLALELWSDAAASMPGKRRLLVLTQCGFPEPKHCDLAVEVCREFCAESGVEWAGALAFGMGGAIEKNPVEKSPLARSMKAFDDTAEALAAGRPVPDSATAALRRQLVPSWIYRIVGWPMWWWLARKRGATEPLNYKRYPQ